VTDTRSDRPATFVIIHAMGNDIDCWQTYPHFWRFLEREGAVPWVLPGDTGRPREKGWTVEGMADEIAAAFTGPLDLMGFANGAVIIQSILERHNERVRSAIIVNARFASAASAATRSPIDMSGAAPPMADLIDAGLQRWFSPFAVAWWRRGASSCAWMRRRIVISSTQRAAFHCATTTACVAHANRSA
jgi:pimeloyl-ACP methyl ester carboxylesterase